MGRGNLSDEEWERPRPFLPVSNGRCGQWRNHRQVSTGFCTGCGPGALRDLPERFGPWKTVYERHYGRPTVRGSVCCNRSRLLPMSRARSAGTSRWAPPSCGPTTRGQRPDQASVGTCVKGGRDGRTSGRNAVQSLLARLVKVQELGDWAARGAVRAAPIVPACPRRPAAPELQPSSMGTPAGRPSVTDGDDPPAAFA
ncbi:transposase [Streptomyces lydicus]|uniref:transposase n=1 Tax=Streptomyces lydicus TaxID=47763 RepID=UPI0036BFFCE7